MLIDQNLLALTGGNTASGSAGDSQATDANGQPHSFAELLGMQDPAELENLLEQLGISDPAAALAGLKQLEVDGKLLPADDASGNSLTTLDASEEDQQLAATLADASPESVAAVAAEWLHWLGQARMGNAAQIADNTEGLQLRSLNGGDLQNMRLQLNRSGAEHDNSATSLQADAKTLLANGTPGNVLDLGELGNRAELAARLAGALGSRTDTSASTDSETSDSSIKALAQASQSSQQAALTARPVNPAMQALGVPFGQTGYSEALVEKVMWMSSQNLRSAEIRLDPAELGPLEIHIQSRGQEHQIQFVSLNPSVREALEAQVFRLREMFTEQGLDLQNVSVSDQSAGQQQQQQAAAGDNDRGDGRQSGNAANPGSETGDSIRGELPLAANDRLIDFYA